ncbi:MAG: hypothetical protein K2X93_07625 [Candidatus Obscuribacterales bacterium]|nr:hypothetical protein [Candidatus Obscuribacterales bacterium]
MVSEPLQGANQESEDQTSEGLGDASTEDKPSDNGSSTPDNEDAASKKVQLFPKHTQEISAITRSRFDYQTKPEDSAEIDGESNESEVENDPALELDEEETTTSGLFQRLLQLQAEASKEIEKEEAQSIGLGAGLGSLLGKIEEKELSDSDEFSTLSSEQSHDQNDAEPVTNSASSTLTGETEPIDIDLKSESAEMAVDELAEVNEVNQVDEVAKVVSEANVEADSVETQDEDTVSETAASVGQQHIEVDESPAQVDVEQVECPEQTHDTVEPITSVQEEVELPAEGDDDSAEQPNKADDDSHQQESSEQDANDEQIVQPDLEVEVDKIESTEEQAREPEFEGLEFEDVVPPSPKTVDDWIGDTAAEPPLSREEQEMIDELDSLSFDEPLGGLSASQAEPESMPDTDSDQIFLSREEREKIAKLGESVTEILPPAPTADARGRGTPPRSLIKRPPPSQPAGRPPAKALDAYADLESEFGDEPKATPEKRNLLSSKIAKPLSPGSVSPGSGAPGSGAQAPAPPPPGKPSTQEIQLSSFVGHKSKLTTALSGAGKGRLSAEPGEEHPTIESSAADLARLAPNAEVETDPFFQSSTGPLPAQFMANPELANPHRSQTQARQEGFIPQKNRDKVPSPTPVDDIAFEDVPAPPTLGGKLIDAPWKTVNKLPAITPDMLLKLNDKTGADDAPKQPNRLGSLGRTTGQWATEPGNLDDLAADEFMTSEMEIDEVELDEIPLDGESAPIIQNFQMFYQEFNSAYAHSGQHTNLEITPESAEEAYLRGNIQEACLAYHTVIERLEDSANPDLDQLVTWLETLADIYILLDDPESAASLYFKARQLKPEKSRRVQKYLACLLKLATKYEDERKSKEAEAVFVEMIKIAADELDENDILHQRINDSYVASSRRKAQSLTSYDDQCSTVRLRAIEKGDKFDATRKPRDIIHSKDASSIDTSAYRRPEFRKKLTVADIEFAAAKGAEQLGESPFIRMLNSLPVQIIMSIALLACGASIFVTLGIGEKHSPIHSGMKLGTYKTADQRRAMTFQKKKSTVWLQDGTSNGKGKFKTVANGDFADLWNLLPGHLKKETVFYTISNGIITDDAGRKLYDPEAPEFKVIAQMRHYANFAQWHYGKYHVYPDTTDNWLKAPGANFRYLNPVSGKSTYASIVPTQGASSKDLDAVVGSGQVYLGEPQPEPGRIACVVFDHVRFFIRGFDRDGKMICGDTPGQAYFIECSDGTNVTEAKEKEAAMVKAKRDKKRYRIVLCTRDPSIAGNYQAVTTIGPACLWLFLIVNLFIFGGMIAQRRKVSTYIVLSLLTAISLVGGWYYIGLSG